MKLVDTTADKMSGIKPERFACTLGYVDFDSLLKTLTHTLAELQVEKHADKLYDVKDLPRSICRDTRDTSREKEKDTCREPRRDVEVKAFVKTLAYRLAEVKAKKVKTH